MNVIDMNAHVLNTTKYFATDGTGSFTTVDWFVHSEGFDTFEGLPAVTGQRVK